MRKGGYFSGDLLPETGLVYGGVVCQFSFRGQLIYASASRSLRNSLPPGSRTLRWRTGDKTIASSTKMKKQITRCYLTPKFGLDTCTIQAGASTLSTDPRRACPSSPSLLSGAKGWPNPHAQQMLGDHIPSHRREPRRTEHKFVWVYPGICFHGNKNLVGWGIAVAHALL